MEESTRERRLETTYKKSIYLTPIGLEKIEAWAQTNGLNFSAAIETLALLGLADEQSTYLIPALRATTLQAIRLTFNRIARLLSDVSIEAAASRTMTEGIMLQMVRQAAYEHPDDFEAVMSISRDGRRQSDARIRHFHEEIKVSVGQSAVQRLRKSLSRVNELLVEDEETETA